MIFSGEGVSNIFGYLFVITFFVDIFLNPDRMDGFLIGIIGGFDPQPSLMNTPR